MTGLIFGTIVAAWAAVLVPMWLRRHDERNEARSVERFSSAMRVLSRRGPGQSPTSRSVVMPARERVAEVHVSGPATGRRSIVPVRKVRSAPPPQGSAPTAPPAPNAAPAAARQRRTSPAGRSPRVRTQPAALLGRVLTGLGSLKPVGSAAVSLASMRGRRGSGRSGGGRTSLVVRRRRTLVTLLVATVLLAILALASVAPVWLAGLAAVALVGYVVHLRAQARIASQSARRRSAVDQRTAARAARRTSAERVRAARARGERVPGVVEDIDGIGLEELLEDDAWEPRDVLLPTYVTKPQANRMPDDEVAAFWGDARRDDEVGGARSASVAGQADWATTTAPVPAPLAADEDDEALDDELGAIIEAPVERRRVVGE